jgi:hypothetical protein
MISNPQYLDEFIGQQTDAIHLRLLQSFRAICRQAHVPESEFAANLRQKMDEILAETSHEDFGSDNQ